MDFMLIYTKYDVSSELMMIFTGIVMLALLAITQPRRDRMMKVNTVSFITGIIATVVHLQMLYTTCKRDPYQELKFTVYYLIFTVLYIIILHEITIYIDWLSYRKRNMPKKVAGKLAIQTVVYIILFLYPLLTKKLYYTGWDGRIQLTNWHFIPSVCGILCALCALMSTIINRKSVSKIVAIGVTLFCPFEILVFNFQFMFSDAYFLSFTYMIPFTIFFYLFHSDKFDAIVGCQGIEAMYTLADSDIRHNRNYAVIVVTFPQLKNREYSDVSATVDEASAFLMRKIERLRKRARMYSPNIYTYAFYSRVKDGSEAEEIAAEIRSIIGEPIQYKDITYKVYYKQIVLSNNPTIKDATYLQSCVGYFMQKMSDDFEDEHIVPNEKDYEKFSQYVEAEHIVLDIRTSGDIEDDRVICFVQPIHSISNDSFKSGEALMRMQVDGKMIFPDVFIPAAEKNNCIHSLTLIMINAVCKKIKELEKDDYDFEGLTVNCSTPELADPYFHKEIIDIVEKNGINPRHLRLEITESLSVKNYTNIYNNMIELNNYGIMFYLDDFGTGYSNLERIANYPFQTIKFDKSILYSALEGETADALIRSQVKFFKNNGFTTVVEGVEDEAQYSYCKDVGFDYIQGYYFAKPQPINSITDYFE